MDKVLEKLVVEISTDQKKLKSEMNQIKGSMKKEGERLGSSFKSGFGSMLKGIGATVVLQQTISFVKKAIQLYSIQEAAEKRLSVAYGKNIESLTEYASALQQKTAYGDEEIIEAQALIAAFVKEEDAIKRATAATLDLAAAKGMDLKVAADLLSKTLGSSTNALSRYGIEVKGAVGSSERLDSAMENLNEKFGGQAAAQLETYAGKLKAVSNAWGDLLEVVGKGAVESLFAGIQTLFGGGGAVGFANNLMSNQLNEQLAKVIKEVEQEFKENLPKAVEKTIVTVDSLEAEIKSLQDQLNQTDITDLVSRDKLQSLIASKKMIVDKFLNPIKKEIYMTLGDISPKGLETFNVDAFGSTDIKKPAGGVDQWYVDLWKEKGKPEMEEQESLWADIGQAQQVAMGNLISNWSSAIKLFEKANSMLQQFLNMLAQVAMQEIAMAAVKYAGNLITSGGSTVADAVTETVPSLSKSSGANVTNALLIQNNEYQKQILNKKQESVIQGNNIVTSYDKSNKRKLRYT